MRESNRCDVARHSRWPEHACVQVSRSALKLENLIKSGPTGLARSLRSVPSETDRHCGLALYPHRRSRCDLFATLFIPFLYIIVCPSCTVFTPSLPGRGGPGRARTRCSVAGRPGARALLGGRGVRVQLGYACMGGGPGSGGGGQCGGGGCLLGFKEVLRGEVNTYTLSIP